MGKGERGRALQSRLLKHGGMETIEKGEEEEAEKKEPVLAPRVGIDAAPKPHTHVHKFFQVFPVTVVKQGRKKKEVVGREGGNGKSHYVMITRGPPT